MTMPIMEDALDRLFTEWTSLPLLSKEEEKQLAERIAGGDKDAIERLILSNIRLVATIAKRYKRTGIDMADLMQEGLMGLMRAAEKYDGRVRFSTYAIWWIRQYIARALPNLERAIYLPAYVQTDLISIHRWQIEQEHETGEPPTVAQLMEHFNKSRDYIEAVLRADLPVLSLERPFGEADASTTLATLADFLEDTHTLEETVVSNAVSGRIQSVLDQLPEREADCIKRRYGIEPYDRPQTFESIAHDYGKSKQRIQQLVEKGQLRLKRLLRPLAKEEELVS